MNVPWVSLVNLNLGREAVAEIIQFGLDITRAERELRAVVEGGSKREKMLSDFDELRKVIGGPGASDRFAARMVAELRATGSDNNLKLWTKFSRHILLGGVLLIVVGLLVKRFPMLIAGYNTMPAGRRRKTSTSRGLSSFMRRHLVIIGSVMGPICGRPGT